MHSLSKWIVDASDATLLPLPHVLSVVSSFLAKNVARLAFRNAKSILCELSYLQLGNSRSKV